MFIDKGQITHGLNFTPFSSLFDQRYGLGHIFFNHITTAEITRQF
ncbi:hypothetical protein [Acinetobacter sp. ANC 4216]